MKPAPFELVRARSVAEAVSHLQGRDGMAKAMAGGQSLVPMLNLRLAPLELVVDLSLIESLKGVASRAEGIAFGACVTHASLEDARWPDPTGGLMRRIAAGIAYRAVRNRGTLGGSVALADPSSDWMASMVALDATIEIEGPGGVTRSIAAPEFVLGAYATALAEDEILTAVVVPKFSSASRFGFYKMCRKTGEFATSIAFAVRDRERAFCRIVVGATGGAPMLSTQAQRVLAEASGWSDALARRLGEAADADLRAADFNFDAFDRDVHRASVRDAVKELLTA